MFSINSGGLRVTGNLNEGIGDAGIGSAAAGQTGLPTVAGAYGQLGACMYLDNAEAAGYTNTSKTNPLLYGGWYKYVQLLSTATAAVAVGQLVFYATAANAVSNIVTTDITAATMGRVAGVILSAAWVKGNYWWIYIGGGLINVLCKASVTDTTDGNLAIISQTPAPTVDGLADATAVTGAIGKSILGVWAEAPSNGLIKRIRMSLLPFTY